MRFCPEGIPSPKRFRTPLLRPIIMEWISGSSLRNYLMQRSGLKPTEAANIAYQIALGLKSAHRQGIVHGDIKPANVMLEPVEVDKEAMPTEDRFPQAVWNFRTPLGKCRAKLADFGLARLGNVQKEFDSELDTSAVAAPVFAGTPAYACPEQLLERKPASAAGDIWSLGATLYHMLVGVPPYSGLPHAIVRQMRAGDPVSPRSIDSRIPRDLESICLKMLSRNPVGRCQLRQ